MSSNLPSSTITRLSSVLGSVELATGCLQELAKVRVKLTTKENPHGLVRLRNLATEFQYAISIDDLIETGCLEMVSGGGPLAIYRINAEVLP